MKSFKKKLSGKSKGNSFERLIAKEMDKWWGVPNKSFWRTTQSGGWGVPGDIAPQYRPNQPSIWFPFIIECKFYKTIDFSASLKRLEYDKLILWWNQLVKEQESYYRDLLNKGDRFKLLIFKANQTPIYIAYDPVEMGILDSTIKEYMIISTGKELLKVTRWDVFNTIVTREKLEQHFDHHG